MKTGVYDDIGDIAYHADVNSLSASGAKKVRENPLMFKWEREHRQHNKACTECKGRLNKDEYDIGHGAHKYVLGVGEQICRIEAPDWRTKDARLAREAAREAHQIPLLAHQDDDAQRMAEVVQKHPYARSLLSGGVAEQSLYAPDPDTGITLRARPDYRDDDDFVDYKTSTNANPEKFAWSLWDFRYYMQAPWYIDVAKRLELVGKNPRWFFVVQEKVAPYQVSVIQIPARAFDLGRLHNRQAIDRYAACLENDDWPGYPLEPVTVDLPAKAYRADYVPEEDYFDDDISA